MNETISQRIRRIGSRYVPYLVLLAALAQIALSFHHHEDLTRHDTCAACEVGHQPGLTPRVLPVATAHLSRFVVERVAALRRTGFAAPVVCDRARGPPA